MARKKKNSMRSRLKVAKFKAKVGGKKKTVSFKAHVSHQEPTMVQKMKSRVMRRPLALPPFIPQHGKTTLKRDLPRDALPPGKRRSKDGNMYWEARKNRSDTHDAKDKYKGRV